MFCLQHSTLYTSQAVGRPRVHTTVTKIPVTRHKTNEKLQQGREIKNGPLILDELGSKYCYRRIFFRISPLIRGLKKLEKITMLHLQQPTLHAFQVAG